MGQVQTGEGELRLTRYGEWLHDGTPVSHLGVRAALNRALRWDEQQQRYYLYAGPIAAPFICEDTAYFVEQIITETSPWTVELNDGSHEPLRLETLRRGSENQIYCTVKDTHRARFTRSAFQFLLSCAVSETELLLDGTCQNLPLL